MVKGDQLNVRPFKKLSQRVQRVHRREIGLKRLLGRLSDNSLPPFVPGSLFRALPLDDSAFSAQWDNSVDTDLGGLLDCLFVSTLFGERLRKPDFGLLALDHPRVNHDQLHSVSVNRRCLGPGEMSPTIADLHALPHPESRCFRSVVCLVPAETNRLARD
jgi:hypothetical protein